MMDEGRRKTEIRGLRTKGKEIEIRKEERGMRFADRARRTGNLVPLRMEARCQRSEGAREKAQGPQLNSLRSFSPKNLTGQAGKRGEGR